MEFITPREDMILMTQQWTGERYEDGRPKVPDSILKRFEKIKTEEAWGVLHRRGYRYQFNGDMKRVHDDGRMLIGRALTAVMVPTRPDVHMNMLRHGREDKGFKGFFNQWSIECLQENDVLVVDMNDKVVYGTYVGGNLSTAIKSKTKNPHGGAVIWGGIRDLQQIVEIPDFQIYYRGVDPTPIGDVMLSGINKPCAIGDAICMPGDVVLGTMSGVLFIPAHLAEAACIAGEKEQCRDLFGFERLAQGIYTSAQIDTRWTEAIMEDFLEWFRTSPKAADYQHLTWEDEIALSKLKNVTDFAGFIAPPEYDV